MIPKAINSREAAYLALLSSLREERYIAETLEQWRQKQAPSPVDFRFAQQIAYGACKMALALDYLASQASDKKKLTLKLKERALVRLAVYQFYYLDRVPLYAIADEMLKIARKHCHQRFVNYLNALLHKLPSQPFVLSDSDSIQDLSVRYSYPLFFVQELIADYSLEQAKEVMALGNRPALTMARLRPRLSQEDALELGCIETFATPEPFPMAILKDPALISSLGDSPQIYIQNITPAVFIKNLGKQLRAAPQRILDLCASPGGKLIAVHDAFPQAILYANDISPERIKRLSENCIKYGLTVDLSCAAGEAFSSPDRFDLIILDVPCSNSGVLNKRPEARWRLSEAALVDLNQTQLRLIEHAKTLLTPQGVLWYMTCSILKKENEALMQRASKLFNLQIDHQQTILPDAAGWDGGYACALSCGSSP